MTIEAILGSGVVAAIITTIGSIVIEKKKKNQQFIEEERRQRREEIQKIAVELHNATYEDTMKLLARLKPGINAYGNNGVIVRYNKDAHIWQLINELETEKMEPSVFKLKQKQLVEYLLLRLTDDLERYKQEAKGDKYGILGIMLLFFSGVFYIGTVVIFQDINLSSLLTEATDTERINAFIVVIVSILYFLIFIPITNYLLTEMSWTNEIILVGTTTASPEKYDMRKLIKCGLVWMIIMVALLAMYIIVLTYLFKITPCGEMTGIAWTVCVLMYLAAEILLSWTKTSFLDNIFTYNQSINKVREKYEKQGICEEFA